MKRFLFLVFLFVGIVFSWRSVCADSKQGGVTLSPMFQEISLAQTDSQKDFIVSLTNNTDAPMTVRLSLLDFGSLDESGGVAFLGLSNNLERKYALASWIRLEKDVVTLLSGEHQQVKVTIENRDSLSPGGHYGAIVFQEGESTIESEKTNEVAIKQLFSVLVFVKKIGGEIYQLHLKGEEYTKNIFLLPDKIRLRFENSGNVHLVPRGTVTLVDPLGRLVARGIINEESGLILPETFRVYPIPLRFFARSFIPGRYTITIDYRYDGKDDFSSQQVTVYFLPLPTLLGCLLFLVMVGWYRMRLHKKKQTSVHL